MKDVMLPGLAVLPDLSEKDSTKYVVFASITYTGGGH